MKHDCRSIDTYSMLCHFYDTTMVSMQQVFIFFSSTLVILKLIVVWQDLPCPMVFSIDSMLHLGDNSILNATQKMFLCGVHYYFLGVMDLSNNIFFRMVKPKKMYSFDNIVSLFRVDL